MHTIFIKKKILCCIRLGHHWIAYRYSFFFNKIYFNQHKASFLEADADILSYLVPHIDLDICSNIKFLYTGQMSSAFRNKNISNDVFNSSLVSIDLSGIK